MYKKKFILFGGIPRSGTTLTCHLFNQYPNSHALVESMNVSALVKLKSVEQRAAYIFDYMSDVYSKIESHQPVELNVLDNQNTNTFSESKNEGHSKRKNKIIKKQPTVITQKLNENFSLILKHPNAFIALLPELTSSFKVFAQIRNPLSVLASWHSLEHPLSQGNAPMAEALHPELKETLANIDDALDRQVALLNWYFKTIDKHLAPREIIKYEDIIKSNGSVLSQIVSQDYIAHDKLESRNQNSFYSNEFVLEAYERISHSHDHACWRFYDRKEIELLLGK